MRLISGLVRLALLLALAGALGSWAVAARQTGSTAPVQAIVVLSGPGGGARPLEGETLARTERGVALWRDGVAPLLVMTGGTIEDEPGAEPVAAEMARVAENLGVPAEALRIEGAAHSTLQNALFTRRIAGIDPAAPVLLVTHRYHLARAWASFRWAGFAEVHLAAAEERSFAGTAVYAGEGIKWVVNAARGAAASVAFALGVSPALVEPWLA